MKVLLDDSVLEVGEKSWWKSEDKRKQKVLAKVVHFPSFMDHYLHSLCVLFHYLFDKLFSDFTLVY